MPVLYRTCTDDDGVVHGVLIPSAQTFCEMLRVSQKKLDAKIWPAILELDAPPQQITCFCCLAMIVD